MVSARGELGREAGWPQAHSEIWPDEALVEEANTHNIVELQQRMSVRK